MKWHQIEIALGVRYRNVEHTLRRVKTDLVELQSKLAAGFPPFMRSKRHGHGIAVKDGENHRDERIENRAPVVGSMRTQYTFNHLSNHRKTKRVSLPA